MLLTINTKPQPTISVITPSLNHGIFLRDTVESVLAQSYQDFEHIVVDGGSTDNTIDVLKDYSHIRWISEKEDPAVGTYEAYEKGFRMSRGKYIIYCCVSDGFLEKNWFKRCVEVFEKDEEVSLIWGLPQYMSEDGNLMKISYAHFFDDPPPQKKDFLPFWLGTGFFLPEGNCMVRRDVFEKCFFYVEKQFREILYANFNYNFNTFGYLPFFLPIIANYGRTHSNQRGQRRLHVEKPATQKYYQYVNKYRSDIIRQKIKHYFRDGRGQIIGEVKEADVGTIRFKSVKHKIIESPFMRLSLHDLLKKSFKRIKNYANKKEL